MNIAITRSGCISTYRVQYITVYQACVESSQASMHPTDVVLKNVHRCPDGCIESSRTLGNDVLMHHITPIALNYPQFGCDMNLGERKMKPQFGTLVILIQCILSPFLFPQSSWHDIYKNQKNLTCFLGFLKTLQCDLACIDYPDAYF